MNQSDAGALASGIFAFKRWFRERTAAEKIPVIVAGMVDGHTAFQNGTCQFFVVTTAMPKYSTDLCATSLMALGRGKPENAGRLKGDLERIMVAIRPEAVAVTLRPEAAAARPVPDRRRRYALT